MDDFFEHIHDYLDGTLAPADRDRFEHELAQNDRLRAEMEYQRELSDTIGKHLVAAEGLPPLRQTLEQVGRRHFKGRKRSNRAIFIRWLIPVAAAACLLAVVDPFGWWATDFEALPHMAMQVSRGDSTAETAERAAALFNAGDYAGSTELLEALVAADTTVTRHRYFLGLNYVGLSDDANALRYLQPIADGPSVFADDARYFTALVLLRLGDHAKATHYAGAVPRGNAYYTKAQKLIRRLSH